MKPAFGGSSVMEPELPDMLMAVAGLWSRMTQISAGPAPPEVSAELKLAPKRKAWVQVVRGEVEVNGRHLGTGDALGLVEEPALRIDHGVGAEVLVFDLA